MGLAVRMRIMPVNEAWTGDNCPLCGKPHRLMHDGQIDRFRELGFTEEEIEAIGREAAQQAGAEGDWSNLAEELPPGGHRPKPSDSRSRQAERKQRERARRKAQAGGSESIADA